MTALFILLVIVLMLALDIFVIQRFENRAGRAAARGVSTLSAPAVAVAPGLFYARGHTSVRIAADGSARIGIDDFARHALGGVDRVELPRPGLAIERGAALITAVRGERRLVFPSPLTGTVRAVKPENADGGERDWVLTLSPRRLGMEIGGLFVAERAIGWLRKEFERFREFLVDGFRSDPACATLPDGGEPARGALALLPEDQWHEFEDEFLAGEVAR
jgi:glycine cleavage system H lipoate-binding protein